MNRLGSSVLPPFGYRTTNAYTQRVSQVVLVIALGVHCGMFSRTDREALADVDDEVKKGARTIAKTDAVAKLLGYLPLVGTVMGFKRIKDFYKEERSHSKRLHLVRGVVEVCSVGAVLIPVDALATIVLAIRK